MKRLFAAAALLASLNHAYAGELTLYSRPDFRGADVTLRGTANNFTDFGFNDRASSIVVRSGTWEVCEHKDFGGHCSVLEPGEYRDLSRFNDQISSAREVDRWRDRGGRHGRDDRDERWRDRRDDERRGPPVELFAAPRFGGSSIALAGDVRNLTSMNFNDRAGSLIVREGEWEVCQHADYRGRCAVYGPGRHPFLEGLNNELSSVRRLR